MSGIFISIACYRDPDVVNTVRSAYDNASNKENLFFCVVSQDEDDQHPDLSFIPENQVRLIKTHWSESMGLGWARELATRDINQTYFLQIDSHSRFVAGWDSLIVGNYERVKKFWGSRLILTAYPDPFEVNWATTPPTDVFNPYPELKKISVRWASDSKLLKGGITWPDVVDTVSGDEVLYLAGGSLFCYSNLMAELPYDKLIYFDGEEGSMSLRAYTRGMRMVSPVVKYMYSNYNRENTKRPLHWSDHSEDWVDLNRASHERLEKLFKGDRSLGVFGIASESLYQQYQKLSGIDFQKQDYKI